MWMAHAPCACPQVEDSDFGRRTRPVVNVTWYQAQQYTASSSKMTDLPYRLLTKAEWEYAARAGSTGAQCGQKAADLDRGAAAM